MEDFDITRLYARYIRCGDCLICIPHEKYFRMVHIDKWMAKAEYKIVMDELMLFPDLKKALFLQAKFEDEENHSEIRSTVDLVMDVVECMSSKMDVVEYDTFVQCAWCGEVTFMCYQHGCNLTELSLYKTKYYNVINNWCYMHDNQIFVREKYFHTELPFI